jgi:hypothetical protein
MTDDELIELLQLTRIVSTDGTIKCLNRAGHLHRIYGPAVEYTSGTKEWWKNGKLHRTDGPAVECDNGDYMWYQNGIRHRIYGPMVEWSNGVVGERETNQINLTQIHICEIIVFH